MSNLGTTPVEGSAFEEIALATTWEGDAASHLRVADNLGWLVTVDEHEQVNNVVGFSIEATNNQMTLWPPTNFAEVRRRHKPIQVGLFNTDGAAKGIGSHLANIPKGLQPHSIRDQEIAVRRVPFTAENDMFTRNEPDTLASRAWRLLRHGGLLLASATLDELTDSTRGTAWAAGFMERDYGNARLVRMPVPPIWHYQQQKRGVKHTIPPQVILARGDKFARFNPMNRVGSYPVSALTQEN